MSNSQAATSNKDSSPTLSSMGINNPSQIVRYALWEEGHNDIIKIFYKRKPGSFLPDSRKYKFGRTVKTYLTDSGKGKYEETYEISPVLQKAITELDQLIGRSEDCADIKSDLLQEINQMEKSIHHMLSDLREKVEKI